MRALRHAEKWRLGQPLARDVIGYHVATAVVVQCRAPTAGLRDVRVTVGVPSIAAGTCNSSAGASAHLRFPGITFACRPDRLNRFLHALAVVPMRLAGGAFWGHAWRLLSALFFRTSDANLQVANFVQRRRKG